MATTAAVQTTECNKDGGIHADNNALALLAISSPSCAMVINPSSGMNNGCTTTKGGNGVDSGAMALSAIIPHPLG